MLKRFCRFAGVVRPRFTPDGVLLQKGQDGAARAIGPGTAVTAAVIRDSRYGVISEVLVKNKARGSAETVKNAAYLARGASCRRVLAVPRRTGGDAMRYLGMYKNKYDNQALLISAILAYFATLERQDVLDPDYDNTCGVDTDAQKAAWEAAGTDTSEWTDAEARKKTFKSNVYLSGTVRILDAMEDLKFAINLAA